MLIHLLRSTLMCVGGRRGGGVDAPEYRGARLGAHGASQDVSPMCVRRSLLPSVRDTAQRGVSVGARERVRIAFTGVENNEDTGDKTCLALGCDVSGWRCRGVIGVDAPNVSSNSP